MRGVAQPPLVPAHCRSPVLYPSLGRACCIESISCVRVPFNEPCLSHCRRSICLGLFALLCWDAIFAAEVPAFADPSQYSRPSMPSAKCETTTEALDAQSAETLEVDSHIVQEDKVHRSAEPVEADGNTNRVGDTERDGEGEGDAVPPRSSCCPDVDNGAAKPSQRPGVSPVGVYYAPFLSPFQSEPFDLMTTAFAGRRREILEDVYGCIERGEAAALVRRNWNRHYGRACTGENTTAGSRCERHRCREVSTGSMANGTERR